MTNQEIAAVFRRMGDLLELGEENEYKIRSYRRAAEMIEDTPTPLARLVAEGGQERLRELPGIGAGISQKIIDLLQTGTFQSYEEIKAKIPETVLDLLQVEGIGFKTMQLLYQRFHITNLPDFARFVGGGGLASVPRLSGRSEERIRHSLKRLGLAAGAPNEP
jgi:DNA polymerase (family 10)